MLAGSPPTIALLHKPFPDGHSQVFMVRASDRRTYAVKFTPVVPRSEQACELICGQLAELVGAPAPTSALLELTQDLLDAEPRLRFEDGSRPQSGLAVGTRYVGDFDAPPTEWSARLGLVADADLGGIVVFDTWLGVTDRHPGNYAFNWESGEIRLASIDFASALQGSAGTKPVVPDVAEIATIVRRDWAAVEGPLRAVERVTGDEIRAAVAAVPSDWLGTADRDRIAAYLSHRQDELRTVLEEAANA